MSAIFSSKIGKFAFAILSVSGASLLLANVLSSSLRATPLSTTNSLTGLESFEFSEDDLEVEEQDEEGALTLSDKRENQALQYKKCKALLTSKNDNYRIVACDDSPRSKKWYLFDGEKSTLEKIDGLTTENNSTEALDSKDEWWKNKQWQGFKGRATWRYWGKNLVGAPFAIKYPRETSSTEFPFFKYLKLYCRG